MQEYVQLPGVGHCPQVSKQGDVTVRAFATLQHLCMHGQ